MLYWPVLIIASVIIGVFLTGGSDTAVFDSGRQQLSVYMAVIGAMVFLGGMARILAHAGGRGLVQGVLTLGLCGMLLSGFALRDHAGDVVSRVQGELMPSVALSRSSGEVELRRAWDGHYRAIAEINGVEIRMMVDTGASMVLLPYEAMDDLGIDADRLVFSVPVTTANGRSSVAPLKLDEIRVGTIRVENVLAAVSQPGRLESALLGMSFLERLTETTFRGNKLILRQGAPERGGRFISVSDQF